MLSGVYQEFRPRRVHGKREVVGNAFVHGFARRQAERGGEVFAGFGMVHLALLSRGAGRTQPSRAIGGRKSIAVAQCCCRATNDPRKFPPLNKAGPQWRLNSARPYLARGFACCR
jgi:hypothetical protein